MDAIYKHGKLFSIVVVVDSKCIEMLQTGTVTHRKPQIFFLSKHAINIKHFKLRIKLKQNVRIRAHFLFDDIM